MAKNKYAIKKFDGDDSCSWAIFNSNDVKGKGSIIFYGEAQPIMCGLSRLSAQSERDRLNKKVVI